MGDAIRVLLVEDSDAYRESLAYLLQRYADIEVVGGVAAGGSAAATCAELSAHVVVIDYRLPDVDGAEVAEDVRRRCPDAALVFLSASRGAEEQRAARRAGAPLVGKDEGMDAVVEALRAAAGGRG